MKILQISSAQSFGGGERYVADLTTALQERGHEVHIVVRPNSPIPSKITTLSPQNVSILPMRNALDVQSANELARIAREQQSEIIHAHMARDYPLAAYAARRNPHAKLIVTRHVLFPLNRLHGRILARAARVIAVSQAVARQLNSQRLLPAERISVVPNGVDVERLRNSRLSLDRADLHQSWGLAEGCLLVGSLGQLNPLKGHEIFVRAAALVLLEIPQARFVIAGEDDSPGAETRLSVSRLITELNLQDKVRLLGRVDDVGPFLAALDLFVSASRTESFGLGMAEAMASGIPVVATSTGGALEIIRHGETGIITDINEPNELAKAIIFFLSHPEQRELMGQSAFEYARDKLSLQQMVDAIERIYRESHLK
jgi:glycosyltransferase involved in cell wall biosynthesis